MSSQEKYHIQHRFLELWSLQSKAIFKYNKFSVTILVIYRSPASVSLDFVSAVVWRWNAPPIDPCIWSSGLQLLVLNWEVVEPVGGGALQEEVGWIVWPHFLCVLCFLTSDALWPTSHISVMTIHFLPWWTTWLQTVNQTGPSPPKLFFVKCLVTTVAIIQCLTSFPFLFRFFLS